MERTSIRLGGVELGSSIMNASGARSVGRGEIYELSAVHNGAVVFKSCNLIGLDEPENLKNPGVEHFAAVGRELSARGKPIVGSVVGARDDEIATVARQLDRAGVSIIELNLADDYVAGTVRPFASFERLAGLIERVRGEVGCVLALKLPPHNGGLETRSLIDLLGKLRVEIVVCANDLPRDLEVDVDTGAVGGHLRVLSHVHRFSRESVGMLDVVAVGGISSGRDAYISHLTGAKAVQVGSALMREGAGALGRIDRELDTILSERGKGSVNEIIGELRFVEHD